MLSENRPDEGRPPVSGYITDVDHPSCGRRFRIAPGADFSWEEAVSLPSVAAGPALLTLGVQVLWPQHCDRYGCHDTMLAASRRVTLR